MLGKRVRIKGKAGFTLVELLVVIGIIGVLVSILLPSLLKARRAAIVTHCQSTIRGMMQAVAMYQGANKSAFPYQNAWYNRSPNPGVITGITDNATPSWISVLIRDKYLARNGKAYQCYERNYRGDAAYGMETHTSYVANGVLTTFPKLRIKGEPVLVFIMDEYDSQPNAAVRPNARQAFVPFSTEKEMSPEKVGFCNWFVDGTGLMYKQWHDNGRNYGFTDGHVEYKKAADVRSRMFGLLINGQDLTEGLGVGYTDVTRMGRIIGY